MRLRELLAEAGYALPPHLADCEIAGICSDSRKIKQGELFVALRGLCADGQDYIAQAAAGGAVFFVSERACKGLPHLRVESAREALARLFDAWYGHPTRGLRMIGITGTNGKTSTATMLHAILRHAGLHCGLVGTVECRFDEEVLSCRGDNELANMTTPDPKELYALLCELARRGADCVVMEVTSHALFFEKTAPIWFEVGVFTNLTVDHLDLHGDMESYFMQKCALFASCRSAVVSLGTTYGQRLFESLDIPSVAIGEGSVKNVEKRGDRGVRFTLCALGEEIDIDLPVPGEFSVENGALAAAAARLLGVKGALVAEALRTFGGVRGRLERLPDQGCGVTVFIDYAHTPDALEKLLLCVRGFRGEGQRILLLFGCGGDRDKSKRAQMGRIASRLADFLILTSDNSRTEDPHAILRDILFGVDKEKPYCVIPDRKRAIDYAASVAKRGDIVILAGKGHEEYEIVGDRRLPFLERELMTRALLRKEKGEEYEN